MVAWSSGKTSVFGRRAKERQEWCYLQVKLCDPCLSALYVPWCEKAIYKYSSFPFLSSFSQPKGAQQPPLFGLCLLWPNDSMHQHATWYGGRPWPTPQCIRWGASSPQKGFPAIGERGTAASLFSAHAYCGHGRPSQLLLSSCWLYCTMHQY